MQKISILILIVCGMLGLNSSEQKIGNYQILKRIDNLELEFGKKFYHSLFSIDELRPYSILQSEKTLNLYSEDWLSSTNYIEVLDDSDIEILKEKILLYLNSLPSSKTIEILDKIRNWCIIDMQFTVFRKYGLDELSLVSALYNSEFTNEIFDKYIKSGPFNIENIDTYQRNEILNDAKNLIASQPTKDQLYFHSSLYKNFALEL